MSLTCKFCLSSLSPLVSSMEGAIKYMYVFLLDLYFFTFRILLMLMVCGLFAVMDIWWPFNMKEALLQDTHIAVLYMPALGRCNSQCP